jgi:hypothetical protein
MPRGARSAFAAVLDLLDAQHSIGPSRRARRHVSAGHDLDVAKQSNQIVNGPLRVLVHKGGHDLEGFSVTEPFSS